MSQSINRRSFLKSGAIAASGLGLTQQTKAGEAPRLRGKASLHETARDIPVVFDSDVVVCGAGPAGVSAAIAAARKGARVLLVESHGQLGGIWTTGLLSWIIDAGNKDGIMAEIAERIQGRVDVVGGRRWTGKGSMAYDVEQMKLILEQLCTEAKVQMRLHTRVAGAVVDEVQRITHCVMESKSGREAVAGKVFVDCTGDGDVAAQAGCGFDWGRPEKGWGSAGTERKGETQPFSLMMLITGIDPDATAPFHVREGRSSRQVKAALLKEFRRAGVEPSYGGPTIFQIHNDLFAWMINHEYGCSGIDADDLTRATLHAREELNRLVDALRTLGDPWREIKIVATAAQIGVREGRRIHGRYQVSVEDMLSGVRHDDAVCRVTFGIDVHSTSRNHSTGIEKKPDKAKFKDYDIPLGALIAKDVDGLMMAGRCISGDFLSHSSYRVTGNASATGEGAGVTAALAAKAGTLPHEVPWGEVKNALYSAGTGKKE